MASGYIKIYRRLTEWGWYKDSITKAVFLHLLLMASYDKHEFRGHELKPGQVICGRKQLAEDLGLSERQIRTSLNHLKSTNEVTIKTTNKFSVITIENWAKYQCDWNESDQQNDQQSDQQPTSNRPHTRNKEGKEYKRVARTPSFEEISEYVKSRGYEMDPEAFFDYYEETEWHKKNGQPIKDWKASVRTWARREKQYRERHGTQNAPVEPPKYKEFEPEPEIDAVEMPDDVREKMNKILGEA